MAKVEDLKALEDVRAALGVLNDALKKASDLEIVVQIANCNSGYMNNRNGFYMVEKAIRIERIDEVVYGIGSGIGSVIGVVG